MPVEHSPDSQLDKTALTYTSIMGILYDTKMTGNKYAWLGSIFCEWPSPDVFVTTQSNSQRSVFLWANTPCVIYSSDCRCQSLPLCASSLGVSLSPSPPCAIPGASSWSAVCEYWGLPAMWRKEAHGQFP